MRSAAASAIAPDRDRVVVRAGRPADELLKQRMGVVAELEQADAGDDPQGVLDERQASAEQEARHQAPAGAPEAVVAHQVERLVLPQSGRPGDEEVSRRGRRADLDQLGAGPDLAQREHAGRRPSHDDQEMRNLGAERDARQDARART